MVLVVFAFFEISFDASKLLQGTTIEFLDSFFALVSAVALVAFPTCLFV